MSQHGHVGLSLLRLRARLNRCVREFFEEAGFVETVAGRDSHPLRNDAFHGALTKRATSVLHIAKGPFRGRKVLDGNSVDAITAFLFHRSGHADPVRLAANTGKSSVGSYVLGMGFTFDDTDRKGVASSLADMQRLIDSDPRNREVSVIRGGSALTL